MPESPWLLVAVIIAVFAIGYYAGYIIGYFAGCDDTENENVTPGEIKLSNRLTNVVTHMPRIISHHYH